MKNLIKKFKDFKYNLICRDFIAQADKMVPGAGYLLAIREAFGPAREIYDRFGFQQWRLYLLDGDVSEQVWLFIREYEEQQAIKAEEERVNHMVRDNERDLRQQFPELAEEMGL